MLDPKKEALYKEIAVVDNCNMALSHDGLNAVAIRLKVDPAKLERNELIVFLNRAKTRMKVLGGGGAVIGYVRMSDKSRIPLEAIQYLPEVFSNSGKIDINQAVEKLLVTRLKLNRETSGEALVRVL